MSHLYTYIPKKKAECTKEKHTAKHRVTKKKKETRTKKNREQHQAKKRKKMTWLLMWCNVRAAILNAMLQLLAKSKN